MKKVSPLQFFSAAIVLGLGVLIGAGSIVWVAAGLIYDYEDTVQGSRLPHADVIVCLAGGKGRISEAGELWLRYFRQKEKFPSRSLPTLFIAGMGPQSSWSVIEEKLSDRVRPYLQPDHVVMETQSINTVDNAFWFKRFITKTGWKRIILLTSPYHMRRSKLIFEKVLAGKKENEHTDVVLETYTFQQETFSKQNWSKTAYGFRVTLIEFLKWMYYRAFWEAY